MKKSKLLLIAGIILFQFSQVQANAEGVTETAQKPAGAPPKEKKQIVLSSSLGSSQNGQLSTSANTCYDDSATAGWYCLSSSPALQKYSGMIGVVLSGAAMARSMSDACNQYGKALKLAEMGLTAYNGMCSAAQMSCESSCGETRGLLESTASKLQTYANNVRTVNPADASLADADVKLLYQELAAIEAKHTVCRKHKMNLAAAGVGLMNVVKTAAVAKTCENKTTVANCSTNPNAPGCAQALDCSKKENENVPECVCHRMPNNPGCPGASGDGGIPATARGSNYTGPSAGAVNDKINPDFSKSSDGISPKAGTGTPSDSGGMNPFASGGGNGGNIGGSDGGSAKGTDSKSQKGLNTNILSGHDGGGGGGGLRGGSGRDPMNSAYRAYMPGGAKDPTRGLASKTFGNGEVTAAGSKSNWEKVSERYKDNKPTLVGP